MVIQLNEQQMSESNPKEDDVNMKQKEGNNNINNNESIRQNKVSFSKLFSYADNYDYALMFVGSIGAIVHGVSMPVFFIYFGKLIDIFGVASLFPRENSHQVSRHCMDFVYLSLVMMFSSWAAILRNEIGWFDDSRNSSATLSSRLESDSTLLRSIVVDRSTILLLNIGFVVTAFILAFILNWRLTLVVLAMFPLIVSGHLSEKLFMEGYGGNLSKAYLTANMLAGEAVSNIRTVAAFCAEEKVLDFYARELVEPSKRSFKRGHIAGIFYGVSQFFIFTCYALALWYGSILMGKGLSGFKSIMKSFMVLMVTAVAMGETLAMAPDFLKGNQLVESVFEVLDRTTEVKGESGEDLSHVKGLIELQEVEFCYPSRPDILVLKDFNLKVEAGQTMALVGQSGSGKTSVISLILRFYEPTAGKVMVDGNDLKRLKLNSLRKHIGLVQQEPALFATSIYENIMYGKEGATESEVIEAAKLANAHNFISSLPEGYKTKVGERGVQLSGGQKQRVAIARAVLKNPAILLLDEATSSLDLESERVVQQALDQVMKNRTTIVVAHRLSTIKNADQISLIQDGKVTEHGTHSSLVENKNGAYYKLINIQEQQKQDH